MESCVQTESGVILSGDFFPPFPRKQAVSFNSDIASQLKVGLGLTFCVYCIPNQERFQS